MKKHRATHLTMACSLALLGTLTVAAGSGGTGHPQTPSKNGAPSMRFKATSIQGSITVDGQALAEIPIMIYPLGRGNSAGVAMGDNSRNAETDIGGRFLIENLRPGPYRLLPFWRGYIPASGVLDDDGRRIYYYPGDTATIRMVKGGVITGRVVDTGGVPMPQVPVRAMRLRDPQGHPGGSPNILIAARANPDYTTDDRGVYRIYGLEPGVYLVSAGGSITPLSQGVYDGDGPTYYPSSTRNAATEITLAQGQEVSGIDITYQNFRGHSISGTVTGAIPSGSLFNAAIVVLAQPRTGTLLGMAVAIEMDGARRFTINGVADGNYNIAAIAGLGAKEITLASPRPILVNGDSSGLNLTLTPISRVSGSATVDALPADLKVQCKPVRGLQYCLIRGTSNAAEDEVFSGLESGGLSLERETVPGEDGTFKLQLLGGPGRYHFDVALPDDTLFIKSLTIPADVPGRVPLDASAGFAVAAGQEVKVALVLGEGAAGLSGQLVAPVGNQTSANFGVALIPAEPGSEDDVLRYSQGSVRSDKTFQIRNLSPGRYYVIARRISDEEMSVENSQRPWWNREFRKKLYAEAEKSGKVIEFQPCQRTGDYTVEYKPPTAPTKTAQ